MRVHGKYLISSSLSLANDVWEFNYILKCGDSTSKDDPQPIILSSFMAFFTTEYVVVVYNCH